MVTKLRIGSCSSQCRVNNGGDDGTIAVLLIITLIAENVSSGALLVPVYCFSQRNLQGVTRKLISEGLSLIFLQRLSFLGLSGKNYYMK